MDPADAERDITQALSELISSCAETPGCPKDCVLPHVNIHLMLRWSKPTRCARAHPDTPLETIDIVQLAHESWKQGNQTLSNLPKGVFKDRVWPLLVAQCRRNRRHLFVESILAYKVVAHFRGLGCVECGNCRDANSLLFVMRDNGGDILFTG
ncbi:hypothetical protein B484DRAFT_405045 [Ochromonadaceae sp. CCMP2298]|nr:hypothetical protein B484DRAFT_405045 [Ochromonadaceae sp. CCMP2298]